MIATATTKMSMPSLLLRLEGLMVLAVAVTFYAMADYGWGIFALLLLSPDLAALPYLVNERWGAISYNAIHTYAGPLLLMLAAQMMDNALGIQLSLIRFAHIGMDRLAGYGLKYTEGFKQTHLGRV